MSEMVERVARAIHRAIPGRENSLVDLTPISLSLARAAIEAMREPTVAMCEAVAFGDYTSSSYGGDTNSFEYVSETNAADLWRAMVATALRSK